MKVGSIRLHPVKATAVMPVANAVVELAGLRHDRRWAVVTPDGRRLNATTHDVLLSVVATPDDYGGLTLSSTSQPSTHVPVPTGGALLTVDVSRLSTMVDAGEGAAAWFSRLLDEPVRLAWQDDPSKRTIAGSHGGLGDEPLNLADTGPLLLTTSASLEQLDRWIAEDHGDQPMDMSRFRPNVVVDGDIAPFSEDDWRSLIIGGVPFRFAELCDRCVVTTIDPVTLSHGKEPIRTLARHRRWDGKTWFGIRIVPLTTGTISVGDEVLAC